VNAPRKDNRRHHRVPVALLGRFTSDGTDDGVLQVLDARTRTWRASTPRAECREHGYYALDVEGIQSGAVEDLLAQKCEGPAKPVLVELAASQGVPTADGLGTLIALCVAQLVRVEPFRKRAEKIEAALAQSFLLEQTTPEGFDAYERMTGERVAPEQRAVLAGGAQAARPGA
jgi:hypothetical protein